MIPFIQRVTSRSRPLERAARRRAARATRAAAHDLDRQRGDVVVGGHRLARRRSRRVDRARPRICDALDRRAAAARRRRSRCEVRQPTGRSRRRWSAPSSTRSARPPARARSNSSWSRIEPAGARAHLARPRGHQRAREPVGEELLERRRALRRRRRSSHQLCELPLPEPPLVAAREQRQQPLHEATPCSCGGMPSCVADLEHEAASRTREVVERLRQVRGRDAARCAPAAPARAGRARRRPDGRAPSGADGIRRIVSGRCR